MIRIVTRLVPREQHLAYFVGLYHLVSHYEVSVGLLGTVYESPLVNKLLDLISLSAVSFDWDRDSDAKAGEALAMLMKKSVVMSPAKDCTLFLDDDVVLPQKGLDVMLSRMDESTGVIGLTSDWATEVMMYEGYPAFDMTCSLVPASWGVSDRVYDLLSRLNHGGEFLLLDWYYRKKGGLFNVAKCDALHLYKQDRAKLWGERPQQWWKDLSFEVRSAKTFEDVTDVFTKKELADELMF